MLVPTLQKLFKRDLEKLRSEIAAYKNEANIWITEKEIPNSAGNLCLHLIGNLNAFIGAEFGKTGFVRHRELEFTTKDIPQASLVKQVEDTIQVVEHALNQITEEELENEYPVQVFAEKMTTGFFLVHLAAHLGYHLGQINYHRRLLDF